MVQKKLRPRVVANQVFRAHVAPIKEATAIALALVMHGLLLYSFPWFGTVTPNPAALPSSSIDVMLVPQALAHEPKPELTRVVTPPIQPKRVVTMPKAKAAVPMQTRKTEVAKKAPISSIKPTPLPISAEVETLPRSTAEAASSVQPDKPVIDDAILRQQRDERILQLKQAYITQVLALIEGKKHYPGSARRRHLEGEAQASFDVDSSGSIAGITVHGSQPAFNNASQTAILQAVPLPPPPVELATPLKIQFVMQYRLNGAP